PNTQGIGARVRLLGGALTQSQEIICGGRYLSGDQATRTFAADPGQPMQLGVKWRGGSQSTLTNTRPNGIYEVDQAVAAKRPAPAAAPGAEPFFADASSLLNHVHVEDAFDDWARQPSLPRRLSRLGPGVSWYDLDGDGWEDLIVTTGQ